MLKKVISYEDFNGVQKSETHYFSLSETELTKMQLSAYGTMDVRMKEIVDSKDAAKIMEQFHDLIRLSYGVKTPDGRFVKKENGVPLFERFETTGAYDALFMEICTDPKAAADFARGILPAKLQAEADKMLKETEQSSDAPVLMPAT